MTKNIFVTGANKGIGLAICRRILIDIPNSYVFLGARDDSRGKEAIKGLISEDNSFNSRLRFVRIDVSDFDSIKNAAVDVGAHLGEEKLFAVVNNAGMAGEDIDEVINVNVYGVKHVMDLFLPLVDHEFGRVVNVGSAAGANFVRDIPDGTMKTKLRNKDMKTTWADLESIIEKSKKIYKGNKKEEIEKWFGKKDDFTAYGLSKALLHALTMVYAHNHSNFKINACTPGLIETDLLASNPRFQGKNLKEIGCKTPDEGAHSTMVLLTKPDKSFNGNGWYYGSDGLRSPIDKYRSPGDPEYDGK